MGTTQGIWFGKDERLLTQIKDEVEDGDESFSSWMKKAARERLLVDKTLEKIGVDFDSDFERRNELRRVVQREFGTASSRYEVRCRECNDSWLFTDEEEAEEFYEDHERHTDHSPDRLIRNAD
ncbi:MULTISPECIES: hypothetical protein [Halobacterium]|uniref:hypothetical protein n=1 Tax=Halobacterium TaxID=2239 RepID=UPI00073F4FFD|nr:MULTISPECIES: hypothetical protein [Halobacterium]MCG1004865.1 hypothetical protein [Halobacterium noricense]